MTASDDDMIRRGDAVLAVTAADKECLGANGAREFIRAIPAVQVGVKPLEWVEYEGLSGFEVWRAFGILGRYKAQRNREKGYAILVFPNGTIAQYPSIEAAKAAAQADYGSRIRSALTAQPSPDVAALVEALQDLLDAVLAEDKFRDRALTITGPTRNLKLLLEAEDNAHAALARVKGGAA